MKLISWNVNGIRAWHKKDGMLDWVKKQNPDFFLIQETKAESEQLSEELLSFNNYFS
jgi:exonuclease III